MELIWDHYSNVVSELINLEFVKIRRAHKLENILIKSCLRQFHLIKVLETTQFIRNW